MQQVTLYDELSWGADELSPEETRDIPFFGFVTGTLLSLGLWAVIAWTVWAFVS